MIDETGTPISYMIEISEIQRVALLALLQCSPELTADDAPLD